MARSFWFSGASLARRSYFLKGLALLAAAVAIPLLALHGLTLYQQAVRDRAEALGVVVNRADAAARDIDVALTRAERVLAFMATRRELQQLDGERCSELIKGLTSLDPLLANVGAVDMDGYPLCLSIVSATRFNSYRNVEWFKQALTRDGPFLSKPFYGDISRRPIANLVMPLRAPDGRRIGFMGAAIDLSVLSQLVLSTSGLPPNSNVTLIDADDIIIARNPDLSTFVGTKVPTDTDSRAPRNTLRSFVGTGSDGVLRVYARTKLEHYGLKVGAGVPVAAIAERTQAMLARSLLAVAGAVALGFFVALWAARRLAAPLRSLITSTRAQAAGDTGKRADERLPGEFGELAAEFNRMLDAREAMQAMRDARASAEAANQAKSEFLAHISHEIRTPMNAVIGFIRLLSRTEVTPRQADYLDKSRQAADTLLELIDKVLDVSKIEAGKLQLEARAFRVHDVVGTVRSMIDHRAVQRGLALRVNVAAGVPERVVGDSQRFAQVLVNLCDNAVKFTREGSVDVSIDVPHTADDSVSLRVVVGDTGIGMTQEQTSRLFEPFSQADPSMSRRFGGTGLGLAICKQLVALMNGSIEVDSVPGQGSTFTVHLPFARVEASEAEAPAGVLSPVPAPLPAPAPAPLRAQTSGQARGQEPHLNAGTYPRLDGLRVLLVEDNHLNQIVAAELLRDVAGAEVTVCGDGPAALEHLANHAVDAVLMDIQMPGMDGFEAVRRIRAEPRHSLLPIIAMTAHATEQDRQQCLTAGMNDYITKPFDPKLLFEKLGRVQRAGPREVIVTKAQDEGTSASAAAIEHVLFETGLARCAGREDLFEQVMRRFIERDEHVPQTIRTALDTLDFDGSMHAAHTLVSSAGYMGADRLSEIARRLQRASQQRDMPLCRAALDELDVEHQAVRAVVRAHLADAQAPRDRQA